MPDDKRDELIFNGIMAFLAMLPEMIAIIQNGESGNKEEWLARIKAKQEEWKPL